MLASLATYASFQGLKSLTRGIIGTGADYESVMARVKAVSGATADEFRRMGELAIKMGAETEFSTSQAAEAMQYLAMAGLKVDEVMGALPGAMELA